MQIDRIIYPITTLGPGERLAIWTVGCTKHCEKCANPELWDGNPEKDIVIDELMGAIKNNIGKLTIDGVTITGGDPLEQYEELCHLLPLLNEITDDILVYTGYTIEQAASIMPMEAWAKIKQYASVLIDGTYIDDLNDNECALRGSKNQNIHLFDESKRELYAEYLTKGRTVQNVFYNNKMMSVGIHNRDL
jgi:anaerobic ribonucleoside-triphosphate reductase activating protein